MTPALSRYLDVLRFLRRLRIPFRITPRAFTAGPVLAGRILPPGSSSRVFHTFGIYYRLVSTPANDDFGSI